MRERVWNIARKELNSFFSSPVAFIFLCTFLFINLFVFFWVEKFFARNISDVRPLFEWLPILLIFLVSALTMRMWSEENRSGTLEFLLTLPISIFKLVLGKFTACFLLVAIALCLTLPLPISVSFMGELDWGPVLGAYLASFLLASAYISIGLFVSARSDNQVVSLILTGLLCSFFYLLGSSTASGLVGNFWGEVLALVGTGSRFESIARGKIDLRDLYYYLSLTATFIVLNVYSLERIKWSFNSKSVRPVHVRWRALTALLVVNFLVVNFWLHRVNFVYADLTKNNLYSTSSATKNIVKQLQEPLLIRGYFSAKTHPLLAPLVPQLRDMIEEYAAIGQGRIRSEFIDPRDNPEIEEEAAQKYNIKPVPFQIEDKYSAGLVNSYFNILLKYGDKFEVLGFNDLIEVKMRGENGLDVRLRNPEYDLTRAIKKVLYGFQNLDNLFATIPSPVQFVAYVSSEDKLPKGLKDFGQKLKKVVQNIEKKSGGKFKASFVDPHANGGEVEKRIQADFGFKPMVASLLDTNRFYFYLTLQSGDKVVQIALPEDLSETSAEKGLESALKRFSKGFTRVLGIVAPEPEQQQPWQRQFNMPSNSKEFNALKQKLMENFEVRDVDVKKGLIPEDIDLLMVLAPEKFAEKEIFAIDQFLMKGGTIVLATSPFKVSRDQSSLKATSVKTGLEDWLKQYGVAVESKFVMDTQNEDYPVPVTRRGGPNSAFVVQELRMIDYPYFVDIRGNGLVPDSGLTSGLPQVTLSWPSPISIDVEKNKERKVVELLKSSPDSWTSVSTTITPSPEMPTFKKGTDLKQYLLGVVVEGKFDSFFKGKDSPLLKKDEKKDEPAKPEGEEQTPKPEEQQPISGVIEHSASSARIILFSSGEFLADQNIRIAASVGGTKFMNSLQLMENSVDWSLEDRELLGIRGRGQFSHTLNPMETNQQVRWEWVNYFSALLGLFLVWGVYNMLRRMRVREYRTILGL